jgi:WD40-like Beta Propeller Repeat
MEVVMKRLVGFVMVTFTLMACGTIPTTDTGGFSDSTPVLTEIEHLPDVLNPQAVLPNTNGFIYYIRRGPHPDYGEQSSIVSVDQTNDKELTLQTGDFAQEIQSVAGNATGSIYVYSVGGRIELVERGVQNSSIAAETNVEHTNVSMSANGKMLAWQKTVGGVSSIVYGRYTDPKLPGDTLVRKTIAYPTPVRQPSLSGNGNWLTYVHDRPNGLDQIWLYDISNNVYRAIYSRVGTLEHPSVTNDGNKIVFLATNGLEKRIYLIDVSKKTLQQLAYSAKNLVHPFITSDGKYITYGYSSQPPTTNPKGVTVYAKEIASGQLAVVRYATTSILQKEMTWQIPY